MVSLFVHHVSGATHIISGRRAAKLKKALKDEVGQPEIVKLLESGYETFMRINAEGPVCIEDLRADDIV